MAEIVVVGAGPAGLMAAWRAALAGHTVTVLERAEQVGGMAASIEVGGVRCDLGSHRLHPSTAPHLLHAVRALLGDDLQVRPRHGRIRLADRWIAFPLRPLDLVTRLPAGFAAGAARDVATSPVRRLRARRHPPSSFDSAVRARLGPTVAEHFYGPYARKLWGTEPAELSAELAQRRVSATGPADVARRLARGRRAGGPKFLYPRRGFGQVAEALADAAAGAGADIRLNQPVEGIHLADEGATVTVAGGATVAADRVWSTAPLPALARRLTPAPPADVLARAQRLAHRAMVLVYLVLDRPQYTEFDAHYFPAGDVAPARLSEPRNYRLSAEDPADRTVLCAEVPASVGDATWRAADGELAAVVADALERQGLPPARPAAVEIRRLPAVYPIYRTGFEWDLAGLDLWARDQPRLLTFGRQGLFVPDNTHHALSMGWEAAGCLSKDGTFDHPRWERARSAFRDHVVED